MAATASSEPSSLLSLSFRGAHLRSTDTFSKSDCFVVVIDKTTNLELGRTETINNSSNPRFISTIRVPFFFERKQPLVINVMDDDNGGHSDHVGSGECLVAEIANPPSYGEGGGGGEGGSGKELCLKLTHKGSSAGFLYISAKERHVPKTFGAVPMDLGVQPKGLAIVEVHPSIPPLAPNLCVGVAVEGQAGLSKQFNAIELNLVASKLKAKDFFSRSSDPYCTVSLNGQEIARTATIKKCLEPQWPPILIPLIAANTPLLLSVYDWDATSADDLIGSAEIEIELSPGEEKCVIAEKDLISKRGSHHGHIHGTARGTFVHNPPRVTDSREFSSSDYQLKATTTLAQKQSQYPLLRSSVSLFGALQAGLQVDTYCAIDFTSSNGSMHKIDKSTPNPYEECIEKVGSILLDYNRTKKTPLLGYGGRCDDVFPPFFHVDRHKQPSDGVQGLLETYRANRSRIDLGDMGSASGGDMTWRAVKKRYYCDDFYAVINHVCDEVQNQLALTDRPLSVLPPSYTILFFVIDGDGFDTEGTNRAIVRASALPISIVLIGVGHSRFENLSSFDADKVPLSTPEGVTAVRDVVSFVRFEDYRGAKLDIEKLTVDLLQEVPGQFESYCALYGISL